MTASYRIGVCGSPQCPRSCGRTGAARQGRLQLYPMAHTLGGNAALHHARMPATDGCIRVIATMLEDPSIPRRADVRLTMWEAADMRTAVACTAEDVCAVDMDGYSERWKRHRRQNRGADGRTVYGRTVRRLSACGERIERTHRRRLPFRCAPMPRRARGIGEDGARRCDVVRLADVDGEESHHVSKSSLARKTIAIRRFFAWALEHGVLTHNPASALKTPKLPQTLPAVLNEPQAGALMDEADAEAARRDDDPHARALALRDCAMLEVLYATGIRVAELVSMDLGSVHYGNRTIIVTGKGDKQRVVPFGVPAQHALEQWTEQGRPCLMTPRSGNALFMARGARASTSVWSAASCTARRRALACPTSRRTPCGTARPRICSTGSGPARGAGDAGAFLTGDDAALHTCVDRAAQIAVQAGVPARVVRCVSQRRGGAIVKVRIG